MVIYFKTPYSALRKVTSVMFKDSKDQVNAFNNDFDDDFTIIYFPEKREIYWEHTFGNNIFFDAIDNITNLRVEI